jgi:hypothetical protein
VKKANLPFERLAVAFQALNGFDSFAGTYCYNSFISTKIQHLLFVSSLLNLDEKQTLEGIQRLIIKENQLILLQKILIQIS